MESARGEGARPSIENGWQQMAVDAPCTVHLCLPFGRAARAFIRRGIPVVLLLVVVPEAARALSGTLSVANATPTIGSSVVFNVNVVGSAVAPAPRSTLSFGDGTAPLTFTPPYPVSAAHVYSAPGRYVATLSSGVTVLSTLVITVVTATARVPYGTIFSTVPVAASVLAGDDTNIIVTYRVVTPPLGSFASNAPSLQAVVDLLDQDDHLISRGDPVLIPYAYFAGGGVETAEIPYTVPSDARGKYHVRVYLRAGEIGGTVAIGQPVALAVTGGPDPTPVITTAVHASGAIEVGPRISLGGTSGTIPASAGSGDINANFRVGYTEPTFTLTAASVLNATSRALDPLLTLVPGAGDLDSPNSQQPVPTSSSTPQPLHYQHTLGPVTAALPSLLFAGGESLRGLDSLINQSGWSYQASLGYPQLASSTSGGQTGYLFDVGRAFSATQDLHATFLQNIDDPYTFVPTGGSAPLITLAGGLEFDQAIGSHLNFKLGDAASGAKPELGSGAPADDGADKAELDYGIGSTAVRAEYHNFGADFATGNGLGATSDSAGGSVTANLNVSRAASLLLGYIHDYKHSAADSSDQENLNLTLSPAGQWQVGVGASHVHSLASGIDTSNDNYNFNVTKSLGTSSYGLNGSLATVSDATMPASAGVTRTGAAQYTLSRGPANLSVSIDATESQVTSPTSTFAESFVLSFPLGSASTSPPSPGTSQATRGFSTSRGFEVQLTADNANSKGAAGSGNSSTRDLNLGAVLSYHLGPHISLGLHALTGHHTDLTVPANSQTSDALRLRADMQL